MAINILVMVQYNTTVEWRLGTGEWGVGCVCECGECVECVASGECVDCGECGEWGECM